MGLCIATLALQLTAISTDHWSVKKKNGSDPNLNIGLWKACGKDVDSSIPKVNINESLCVHLPMDGWKSFPKNSLEAVRAFAILGSVLVFMSLMCMMYMKSYKRCQLVCLVAGGLCSLIAEGIWVAELTKLKPADNKPAVKFDLGYSYYLNMGGGLLALVCAWYYNYGK